MQAHSYYQNVSICENATALDRMGRVFARPGSECSVSANVSLGLNRFYHECNDQETGADMAFFFKRIFFLNGYFGQKIYFSVLASTAFIMGATTENIDRKAQF